MNTPRYFTRMGVPTQTVVNRNYEPNDLEEDVLAILKEGREEGNPWGRATPKLITDRVDVRRQYVSRALESLVTAGWLTQPVRGLYELVEDPREENDE